MTWTIIAIGFVSSIFVNIVWHLAQGAWDEHRLRSMETGEEFLIRRGLLSPGQLDQIRELSAALFIQQERARCVAEADERKQRLRDLEAALVEVETNFKSEEP